MLMQRQSQTNGTTNPISRVFLQEEIARGDISRDLGGQKCRAVSRGLVMQHWSIVSIRNCYTLMHQFCGTPSCWIWNHIAHPILGKLGFKNAAIQINCFPSMCYSKTPYIFLKKLSMERWILVILVYAVWFDEDSDPHSCTIRRLTLPLTRNVVSPAKNLPWPLIDHC